MNHPTQPEADSAGQRTAQSTGQPTVQATAPHLFVLFDGHCALCHASVRWLLRRDRHDRLRFAPAESSAARDLLATLPPAADSDCTKTVLVLAPSVTGEQPSSGRQPLRLLTRSAAVLACLAALPAPWPQLAAIAQRIPLPLRDATYNLIARLRYRLARRYDTCPLPAAEHRRHFLA